METENNNQLNRTRIIPLELGGEMKKSFISYAMAVIINRALPDVRDGLKPVHRRIIYSMNDQGITPDKPHKKSARIVGDVLGKYHPHGDTAIYESMVRMAQDFSTRYLLVDGHGNFGSVDGDGAAAMRYTEARLGKIAMELVRDIDKDTVDFYPNFDGSLQQPVTLPSRFPNLLVNGSGGIAVGMATNIPPHNLGEVIDAACALIDDPDFPTGGEILGLSGIRSTYETGRGRIVVRAKHFLEEEKDHTNIVITEIPYQVNKEQMVGQIKDLVRDKKIEGITNANDESDNEGMRVVIELKRGANPNVVLNQLYKHTQLQTSFSAIMLALVDNEPKILNIKQILEEYIKYQQEIIVRRTKFDLEKAEKRAHIVAGLLKALDFIDEIIHTIRSSRDTATARQALMDIFEFSEVQAQAILDMRLQALTGLQRERLQAEYDELNRQIEYYKQVLSTPALVDSIIKQDLVEIKNKYGDERRTTIGIAEDDINVESLIQEEKMVITLTEHGYVKRTVSSNFKIQRRGGKGITGLSTKDEDNIKILFNCSTHDYIMFFTTNGKVFIKKCYQIPAFERTAKGTPIVNVLPLEDGEKISAVFPVNSLEEEGSLLMVTKNGLVKKTDYADYSRIRQTGLRAIGLKEDDELITVLKTSGKDKILIGTKEGMSIQFDEGDVRNMGRTATGVRGIKLKGDDEVVGAAVIKDGYEILVATENGYGKRTKPDNYREQTRGGSGTRAMKISDKTGKLVGIISANEDEDILLINSDNQIERLSVSDFPVIGRMTQGVRIMRIKDGEKLVSISTIEKEDEDLSAEETEE